jgi:hypothetical protein
MLRKFATIAMTAGLVMVGVGQAGAAADSTDGCYNIYVSCRTP